MFCLLLSAGYGTRLERDCIADKSGKFSDLIGKSKALVPIGESDAATQWLNHFKRAKIENGIKNCFDFFFFKIVFIQDHVFVVTNELHFNQVI